MFHRVKEVKVLTPYSLLVRFAAGEQKQYDVAPLFDKWEMFKPLTEVKGLFEQVKVDTGGYGVSWNDDIDLSCNELWNNGKTITANQSICYRPQRDYSVACKERNKM